MKKELTDILKDPSGSVAEDKNGILRFLRDDEMTGDNKTYKKLYDRLAPLYDLTTGMYAFFRNGGERKRLLQYLSTLEIGAGSRVIEISIGTGRNIRHLRPDAVYYGIDISLPMLRECIKSMKRLKRDISLIQAEAENLPVKDESFDTVFSAGGFNFFNDKPKAVLEMLRIARSGSKLLISDETEKVRAGFGKIPVAGGFYNREKIISPVEHIPSWCKDIEYKEVCGGELYALTFRKP